MHDREKVVSLQSGNLQDQVIESMADSDRETSTNSPRFLSRTWTKSTTWLRLLVYAQPTPIDISLLIIGLLAAIATGVPLPLLAIVFGQLIDDFNSSSCDVEASGAADSSSGGDINSRILLLVYLAIAQFVFIYVHLVCWSMVGSRLSQRIRECYLKSLLRQEPSYFDNLKEGEVSSRLNGDIQAIRAGTSEKVGICISAIACLVGAYIVSFIKYPKLAGILISLIPAFLIMSLGGGHFVEKYSSQLSDHVAAAASIASEALSHVAVVHAFGANERLEASFAAELRSAKAAGTRKAIATGVQAGLMYFIAYAANGLAFWQGSKAIAEAVRADTTGASVGAIFTVIFVVVDATVILSQVAPYIQMFGAASAAFTKLHKDIKRESRIDSASTKGVTPQEVQGRIEFRNVSFTHASRPDVPVLRNVSLDIPSGKHTAIVGPSGSGKSTLAGLIMRLYDPDEGAIYFDGQKVSDVNIRNLRSHISIAQQEGALLDRSILENIAHGLVNSNLGYYGTLQQTLAGADLRDAAKSLREGSNIASIYSSAGKDLARILQMVEQAAKHADAHTFISQLQHTYGTIVGPSGKFLSGGQKQRVALARALIKEPDILILDEATSALDSASERRITAALGQLVSGKTVISIAHRLSTVRNADKIVVLRAGEVVEEGTHAELLNMQGFYANLVQLQSLSTVQGKDNDIELPDLESHEPEQKIVQSNKVSTSISTEMESTTSKLSVINDSSDEKGDAEESEDAGLQVDKSVSTIARAFGPIVRPYLLVLLPAFTGTVIVAAAYSIEAVIFGNTVGNLSPCKTPATISSKGAFFGLMFFILAIAEFFANLASWSLFGWVSENVVGNIRVLIFRTLFDQNLQWHQSANRTPAMLLNFITRDGDQVSGLSGSVLGVVFSIAFNLVLSIVLTMIVAWKIALVCLAIVPLFLGVGIMQLRVVAQFEERHENAYSTSVGIGVESISNIKTIASLSLEDDTLSIYRESLAAPSKETAKVTLHANAWLALAYFIGTLGYALAFWWGGKQIVNGSYSQVEFLIVVFSLLVSAQLWSGMFAFAPELSNARAALGRISTLLKLRSNTSLPDYVSDKDHDREKDIERGGNEKQSQNSPASSDTRSGLNIALRNITFAYPSRPDIKVMNNLSLEILSGQFCALVGSSGAGKSTIVSLIERMYTPASGSILVDGIDITITSDTSFRNEIAYVPQDSALFDGSIRFNIGLGACPGTECSIADIEQACKSAHIHETIMALPEGYETRVGNSGRQFSGGQRQRLAIARALVRKPRLLILDEPTSALDAETESVLQKGLDTIIRETGMTVIVIAHRLKTISRADVIYLLEQGRVTGKGTHEELLRSSQSYRENVLSQTLDA